jgi:predicted Zn-ribbon and HTH transcriptional regulator
VTTPLANRAPSRHKGRVTGRPPPPASETPRQAIRRHLSGGPRTARELSALAHVSEKEVVTHLEHIARSVRGAGARLGIEPSRCQDCGFVFRDRTRLGRPSGCPRCRGQHLTAPLFRLDARSAPSVDREAVAAEWAARGFSCGLWTDAPGQRWEDYTHATDELVIVVEGTIELEVDGRVVRPAVGEEIVVPARARHSVRNIGTTTARWLYGYRS